MSALLNHPQRHPITAEEYLRMGEAGIFAPDSRLELIEGEIFEMAPIGSWHSGIVSRLNRWFVERSGRAAVVSPQNPVIASPQSVPQPEIGSRAVGAIAPPGKTKVNVQRPGRRARK